MSPWLISARVDVGLLMAPALICVGVVLLLPNGLDAPWWVYLFGVLMVDVAHVWSTIFRTYLDSEEFERRRHLLIGLPFVVALICFTLNAVSSVLFWRIMAYVALHHFLKQQVGFSALYRAKQGLPFDSLEAKVEKWLIHALVLMPVIWWHVNLPRHFSWFMHGDFISGLPPWVLWPTSLLTGGLLSFHVFFRIRSRLWSPGRDLWALTTAVVWFGGIVMSDGDFHFTLSNVVAHGIPYFVLVGWVCRRKWEMTGRGPVRSSWFHGGGLAAFLCLLLALAFVEEGLWDVLVWRENNWLFGTWEAPPEWLSLLAVGVLAIPQVTHYILDGIIWKVRDNPGLDRWLLGDVRRGGEV